MIRSLFAVIALALAQAAFAQAPQGAAPGMMKPMPPGAMQPGGPMGRWERVMRRLNLNDDQRQQFERIVEETRSANWSTMGQLMSERYQMRQLMRQEKVDVNAVVEQQRKIDELNRSALRNRVEARNRIQAMLSPEQQRVFRSLPMRGMGRATT